MNAQYNAKKLNSAGQLARQFIQSKLTLLLILTIALFGGVALLQTPRTYNPEIVVPVVNISVSRPGSNADEMLHQVLRPLEGLMSSIPGVDHTYGMVVDDAARLTVRFKVNEDEERSLVKIYNQINSNIDKMPPGTHPPLIQSVSLYDVPLVTITMHSIDLSPIQLRHYANQLLEQLRSVPQVGKSWVMGAPILSVRVWLDPQKLVAHHISVGQIQQALSVNNISLDAGDMQSGQKEIPLRVEGSLISLDELSQVIIGTNNAKPVLLKEVARVELGPKNSAVQSFYATGQASSSHSHSLTPAVTVALARQKGSNGVEVANAILAKLSRIKASGDYPGSIRFSITRDYGKDANDAVNTLIDHLGIAIVSVVILLMLFLGWREASVVIFSIPLILFLVLGIGWLAGQTINRITLFALILSLGLLVDDSIVVIENIHRHLQKAKQKNFVRLVIHAANEIGKPTIIATFTVMLALLPMAFVSGMMGPFMAPIPFNAPLAMLVSLFIAYTVVPYLAYHWLGKKARLQHHIKEHKHHGLAHKMQRAYLYLFSALMQSARKRHLFYLVIVLLLLGVLLQPMWQFIRPQGTNGPLSPLAVEIKMLPDDNVNTFLLSIDSGNNTDTSQTRSITNAVASVLDDNPYIDNFQIYLGEPAPEDFAAIARGDSVLQGRQYAQIRVNLMNKHQRTIGSHAIAQNVYQQLAPIQKRYESAKIKLFESPPGPPVRSQMEAGIYGPDYQVQRQLANFVTSSIYPKIYGMINIDNSVTENSTELAIRVNHNAAVQAGLAPKQVAQHIAAFYRGASVGTIHRKDAREPVDIVLRFPKSVRSDINNLNRLYLQNQQQQWVPLAQVTTVASKIETKPILTRDQYPVVYVGGEVLKSSPAYAVATASHMIGKSEKIPTDMSVGNLGFVEQQPQNISQYQLMWLGEMRLTLDVFRDLGSAFIVAIVLIYILLTAFYQSFFIPLIIMGAIPLTIIGVFPGHWLMNQPFTATSMIGVIALAGIVVRNSLLLIDFILEHQKAGFSVDKAVLESGVERLLPIILTALAIMLGSAIMLSDPVFGGLAISLIFGSFASTVLTLFLIPLIYLSWWKRRHGQR